jgi:hypothetical protein
VSFWTPASRWPPASPLHPYPALIYSSTTSPQRREHAVYSSPEQRHVGIQKAPPCLLPSPPLSSLYLRHPVTCTLGAQTSSPGGKTRLHGETPSASTSPHQPVIGRPCGFRTHLQAFTPFQHDLIALSPLPLSTPVSLRHAAPHLSHRIPPPAFPTIHSSMVQSHQRCAPVNHSQSSCQEASNKASATSLAPHKPLAPPLPMHRPTAPLALRFRGTRPPSPMHQRLLLPRAPLKLIFLSLPSDCAVQSHPRPLDRCSAHPFQALYGKHACSPIDGTPSNQPC